MRETGRNRSANRTANQELVKQVRDLETDDEGIRNHTIAEHGHDQDLAQMATELG